MRPDVFKSVLALAFLAAAPFVDGGQAQAGVITAATPPEAVGIDMYAASGDYWAEGRHWLDTFVTATVDAAANLVAADSPVGQFLAAVGRTAAAMAGGPAGLTPVQSRQVEHPTDFHALRLIIVCPAHLTTRHDAESRFCLMDPALVTLLDPPR